MFFYQIFVVSIKKRCYVIQCIVSYIGGQSQLVRFGMVRFNWSLGWLLELREARTGAAIFQFNIRVYQASSLIVFCVSDKDSQSV